MISRFHKIAIEWSKFNQNGKIKIKSDSGFPRKVLKHLSFYRYAEEKNY